MRHIAVRSLSWQTFFLVVFSAFLLQAGAIVGLNWERGNFWPVIVMTVFFLLLNVGSIVLHQLLFTKGPNQLVLFYVVDKVGRLLLSAVLFATLLLNPSCRSFAFAISFCVYYIVSMVSEVICFTQFERCANS